jgi:hypothetical protein
MVREVARYWWVLLVSGILWLLIAWVVFLLSGINEAGLAALAPGGGKVWHYLAAVLFFLVPCGASSGPSTPSSRWPRCWG